MTVDPASGRDPITEAAEALARAGVGPVPADELAGLAASAERRQRSVDRLRGIALAPWESDEHDA